MSLLVEYSLKQGQTDAQTEALIAFVEGLKAESDGSYHYTSFATEDPNRFIGLLEFDDEGGRQRFLETAAFKAFRDGAGARFTAPPKATKVTLVASTRS